MKKSLRLLHSAPDGKSIHFRLQSEGDGTIAWLSLIVPALFAMKHGNVLLIDEIDASLHPRMTAILIALFKDRQINAGHGQLIFTSHDTSLLGRLVGDQLEPHEVWFTEKGSDGAATLYSLDEFTVRKDDNIERRYLQGRYGAVPMVDMNEIRQALLDAC